MPILKISLDEETFNRLAEDAMAELRSIPDRAVVFIRRSLGLPFPLRIPTSNRPNFAGQGVARD